MPRVESRVGEKLTNSALKRRHSRLWSLSVPSIDDVKSELTFFEKIEFFSKEVSIRSIYARSWFSYASSNFVFRCETVLTSSKNAFFPFRDRSDSYPNQCVLFYPRDLTSVYTKRPNHMTAIISARYHINVYFSTGRRAWSFRNFHRILLKCGEETHQISFLFSSR